MPKKKSVKSELRRIQKIPQYTRRLTALANLGVEVWDTCTDDEERQMEQVIFDAQVAYFRKNLKHVQPNVSLGYEKALPSGYYIFPKGRLPPAQTAWCERVGKYTTEYLLESLEKISTSHIPCKEIMQDKIYAELLARTDSLCTTE